MAATIIPVLSNANFDSKSGSGTLFYTHMSNAVLSDSTIYIHLYFAKKTIKTQNNKKPTVTEQRP